MKVLFRIDKALPYYYFAGEEKGGHWYYPNGYHYFCSSVAVLRDKEVKWILRGAISTGKYIYWPYVKVAGKLMALKYWHRNLA